MGFERSLIGRITDSDKESHYSTRLDEAVLVDSVLEHLQKLLNIRQGSVEMLQDYGLPDFNDLSHKFPYAINEIQRMIRDCIRKYEPRLTQVRVTHVQDEDDPLSLRYDITARLEMDDRKTNIWFETILDAAGKVSIRG